MMDNIMRFIETTRRRLQRFRMVAYTLYGLTAGFAAALLLLILGRFVPISWLRIGAAFLPVAGAAAGMLWGWLSRVPIKEAASVMDAVPEQAERSDMMVTALSFKQDNSPAAQFQRAQAERYGGRFASALKQRLPAPKRKKQLLMCSVGLAAVLIMVFLPNPMDKRVEAAKEQQSWVKQQVKETEELAEELKKEHLSPEDKQKLQEQIDALKKQLENEKNPEKALEKLEEVMKQLEKTVKKQEEQSKAVSELAKQMKNNKAMSNTGKSLQEGKTEQLKQEMKKLTEQVKKMSEPEKKQLSDALKKLAEEAAKNPDADKLKEALQKAADSLKDGKLTKEQEEALQKLAEELAKAAEAKNSSDSASKAASDLAAALASQGLSLADQMAAAGMPVSDTWSTGGSAEALAQAGLGERSEDGEDSEGEGTPGEGEGGEPSGGKGQGSGQGAGQGSGLKSGGALEAGRGSGSGQGPGAGLGSGGRELVTTPRDLKGSGNVKNDSGALTGKGGEVQKGGVSPTIPGTSRPYEEVYKDYAAEARKSLGRNQLPEQMQGLVEDYFTQINPNP